jgi:hypothetical protein
MKPPHDRRAQAIINFTTHGKCRTSVYSTWCAMITRCHNPNSKSYPGYGGRGIHVCERWRKFENFYADMGDRPVGMTLDRRDGNLGYSPDNCRWATAKEQRANTKTVRLLSFNGETLNVTEWAVRLGINPSSLTERLDRGWPLEIALTTGKSHKERSPMRGITRAQNI